MRAYYPAYLTVHVEGSLRGKVAAAQELLSSCELCPHACRVDRKAGEVGVCKTSHRARVCSYHGHGGEEPVISGARGSGTIFFSYCNLNCVFCQNELISREGEGQEVSAPVLADMMLSLQKQKCHNINLVTPTHVVPEILSALELAVLDGLKIPLVYNSSGYDSVETLRILEGIVDIYMPDFKFWDSEVAAKFAGASDYREVACAALREMHRQVGDLVIDDNGLARRGLLVRHLVLPERNAGTREIMKFIANEISANTYVNIMDQYWPTASVKSIPSLSRGVSRSEYEQAMSAARAAGLTRFA